MDSMIRGRNSEGKSRFVLVDDDGRLVMGYRNLEADGRPNEVEGNNTGPYVVVGNTTISTIPRGTLITLDTDPTALPTTPLTGRKWIRFRNEDLIDILLCDSEGVVFRTLEPGEESPAYDAGESVLFYGKVGSGTADIGVRVEEGK